MPCTLITGTPGAGKTLYTVDKLLPSYIGTKVTVQIDPYPPKELERMVYTNIKGLRLDHELIDTDPETGRWDFDIQTQAWKFTGNEFHIRNWHKWAKPGSVIIVDEFQFIWPPRPNGSRVPPDVQAFDTHRHGGIEFILISQDAVNVDRHLTGRCDRHLHVRKVAGFGLSVVYEWDTVSRQLLYRNAITKFPYRYGTSAYKNYVSASTHIKTKRKVPGLVWFILFGVVSFAFLAPSFFGRFTERAFGVQASTSDKGNSVKTVAKIEAHPNPVLPAPSKPDPRPVSEAPVRKIFTGCMKMRDRCDCFDADGYLMESAKELCESTIEKFGLNIPLPKDSKNASPPVPLPTTLAGSSS